MTLLTLTLLLAATPADHPGPAEGAAAAVVARGRSPAARLPLAGPFPRGTAVLAGTVIAGAGVLAAGLALALGPVQTPCTGSAPCPAGGLDGRTLQALAVVGAAFAVSLIPFAVALVQAVLEAGTPRPATGQALRLVLGLGRGGLAVGGVALRF